MEGAGMPSEETEEGGTVALGGQALEIVQRHVGIGRRRHLEEEAEKERREQLGVPRLGRHRVQIAERARGLGEPAALELRQRGAIAGRGGEEINHGGDGRKRGRQMAASPFSPVRMRMASPMGSTKTLPSPMEPVRAAAATVATTFSTRASGTTSSTLTLGRKSMVYSDPRYSSVCPFWRPKPRTSVTVMPMMPSSVSASLTSSSLKGLMIASIFFIETSVKAGGRRGGVPFCRGERTRGRRHPRRNLPSCRSAPARSTARVAGKRS